MEEYNPDKHPEHLEAKNMRKFYDKLDGKQYLKEVIEWHVCKVIILKETLHDFLLPSFCLWKPLLTIYQGDVVPTYKEYSLATVYQNFAETRKTFVCDDYLWVSDSEVYSHYQKSHKKNKGAPLLFVLTSY